MKRIIVGIVTFFLHCNKHVGEIFYILWEFLYYPSI